MVSVSGVRGIVGESLTPELVVRYAGAFGEFCKGRSSSIPEVIIGRDGRTTGKIIANIISSTLLSTGVNVRALGVCPTPTIQLAVGKTTACGGISVTASHNPMPWNGMKFIASTGMFLDAEENEQLWTIARSGGTAYAPWDRIGTHVSDDTWIERHIDAALSIEEIDPVTIRKRKLKIVLDCVNAAGGRIVPELLMRLGCELIEMNCDISGVFAHTPEPIPENLTELARRVKSENADLGIAVDPDVDRLVFITEKGEPYGEEYTVASAVKFILEKERARRTSDPKARRHVMKVVVNLSTTRAVEDIAEAYGAEIIRTPVGEINVAKRMKEQRAIIGGEGSGGVIFPGVHYGRDAIVGIVLILQMLVESGGTLSQLKSRLPQYSIAKGRVDLGNGSPDDIVKHIAESSKGRGVVNTEDGVRIDSADHWVHLRKSNTEPIIRVIAEAKTHAQALEVVRKHEQEIASLTKSRAQIQREGAEKLRPKRTKI